MPVTFKEFNNQPTADQIKEECAYFFSTIKNNPPRGKMWRGTPRGPNRISREAFNHRKGPKDSSVALHDAANDCTNQR